MGRGALIVIAVAAVLACAGGVAYYLYQEHPQYTISDEKFIDVEFVATASFTVTADLDDTKTRWKCTSTARRVGGDDSDGLSGKCGSEASRVVDLRVTRSRLRRARMYL